MFNVSQGSRSGLLVIAGKAQSPVVPLQLVQNASSVSKDQMGQFDALPAPPEGTIWK
jgi:hypothetical protein